MSLSIDGSDAERHDAFRGVPGTFELDDRGSRLDARGGAAAPDQHARHRRDAARPSGSLRAHEDARDHPLEPLLPHLRRPRERPPGDQPGRIRAAQPLALRPVEDVAVRDQDDRGDPLPARRDPADARARASTTRRSPRRRSGAGSASATATGSCSSSHDGNVYPSGFLPLADRQRPPDDIVTLYREHPVFTSLRDVSALQGSLRALRVPPGLRRLAGPGVRLDRRRRSRPTRSARSCRRWPALPARPS